MFSPRIGGIILACAIAATGSPAFGKVLSVLLLANQSTQKQIQVTLKEYSRQHPEITFDVSIVSNSSFPAKLNTLLASGNPPDIVEVTTGYIQLYAAEAVDLGQYTDAGQLVDRYLPIYQEFIKSGQSVIGIPIEATANGLFYNKDLFDKAGVSVPQDPEHLWTWEQFKEAIETVKKRTNCRLGVAYDRSLMRWSNLLYQTDGAWISDDGKSFLPDRDATIRALKYFRELMEAKLIPASSWPGNTDAGQLFRTGVAAAMWSGNWQLKALIEGGTRFRFGTTYFPRDRIRATAPGGEFLIGMQRSPNRDDAAKLILWWAQPENTKQYLDSLGGSLLSPMKELHINYGGYTDYLKPMLSDLLATPKRVAEDLARPAMARIQDDLVNELVLYETGNQDLELTLKNAKQIGQSAIGVSGHPRNEP
jgi:alpha-1,4-digalacturonate transport system substrate-binding protein